MCQKIKKKQKNNNILTRSSGQGMSNVQQFRSDHPQFEEKLLLSISHHAFDCWPSCLYFNHSDSYYEPRTRRLIQ